jgi:hypothetical protein
MYTHSTNWSVSAAAWAPLTVLGRTSRKRGFAMEISPFLHDMQIK